MYPADHEMYEVEQMDDNVRMYLSYGCIDPIQHQLQLCIILEIRPGDVQNSIAGSLILLMTRDKIHPFLTGFA